MGMSYRRPSPDDIYYPDPKRNDHDRIVLISRHMDSIIAERIRTNPEFITLARKRLHRWMENERKDGGLNSRVFLDWKKILSRKNTEGIIQVLLSETEDADRLRSSSPFCGILTEEERIAIFKAHAPITA